MPMTNHVPRPPSALLCSVRVGLPRDVAGPGRWVTAFFKDPVEGPVHLSRENLEGDRQADLKVHGGADKAVCVYSDDHYPAWRQELSIDACGPGWFGENFTVRGQSEASACIGDVYRVGSALVQIAQPRGPCWKLARRWGLPDFVERVLESGRTGWYLRVLEEGEVSQGEPLTLADRPWPQWTVARVNEVTHGRGASPQLREERLELAACGTLAARWRAGLLRKVNPPANAPSG